MPSSPRSSSAAALSAAALSAVAAGGRVFSLSSSSPGATLGCGGYLVVSAGEAGGDEDRDLACSTCERRDASFGLYFSAAERALLRADKSSARTPADVAGGREVTADGSSA